MFRHVLPDSLPFYSAWGFACRAAFILAVALLLAAAPAAAASFEAGKAGQILALSAGGNPIDLATNVNIPLKGWTRMPSLNDAQDVVVTHANGATTWTGRIPVDTGKDYRFEETLTPIGDGVDMDLRVTAGADVPTEGVYFWIDVPREDFSGGKIALGPAEKPTASATMPVAAPAQDPHFLSGTSDRLSIADASAHTTLSLVFDRALPIAAQDTRKWGGSTYTVYVQLAPGLKSGESAALKASLTAAATPVAEPVHLGVDPKTIRYRLDGFGGDYCFNIESPVTQYTLKNLKVAWARTEMSLALWAPEEFNPTPALPASGEGAHPTPALPGSGEGAQSAPPLHGGGDRAHSTPPVPSRGEGAGAEGGLNWKALEAHDQPGTRLRDEFLLAKQIQRMGIPYVISVWQLPTWLYADPERGPEPGGRHVPEEKWPALLECLGSYLLYAKRQYGVEPDLFSFNEADYGVRVKLTPEEAREATKRVGAYFRELGLKTKMLLGDTGGPRGTQTYCLPTAADPDAMQYVGAVSFHSWGGATPEQYGAWGDLAERLHLPLLVAELGVDSGAWRTNPFDTLRYALQEAKMYQDLVLYARPQGTMQWEFTSDYSLVNVEKDASGQPTLEPTRRFFIVKQFCNLTPQKSKVLVTTSDAPKVLLTAFAGRGGVYTFHITNLGGGRKAVLTGLPARIRRLRAVRTGEAENFKELDPVVVKGGRAEIDLAPQSLLTLTTLPAGR